jgi:8-oxo-dGTP diphosphatase
MSTAWTNDYIAHLSIDCVIFGYQEKNLKVLISNYKFGHDLRGLPGGYIHKKESIDQAALRILKTCTGLDDIYLEQFRVFGEVDRISASPHKNLVRAELEKFDDKFFTTAVTEWMTSRFVCIGYYALVNIAAVDLQPGVLENALEWHDVEKLPELTHDHRHIVECAHNELRENLDKKLIGFNLLPETFTMKQVKELYEAIHGRPFARNNFQKKILDLNILDRINKIFTGAANKAPYLYKFRPKQ